MDAVLLGLTGAAWAQWLLRSVAPYTLESLYTIDGANSFHGFAQQQPWMDVLAHFNRVTRGAPLHAQGNMPGKVTLVYAFQLLTSNPNRLAGVMVAASSLACSLLQATLGTAMIGFVWRERLISATPFPSTRRRESESRGRARRSA